LTHNRGDESLVLSRLFVPVVRPFKPDAKRTVLEQRPAVAVNRVAAAQARVHQIVTS
jgi:hypothetical protein